MVPMEAVPLSRPSLHIDPAAILRRMAVHLPLGLILILSAYLRFTGLDWDEGTHLHPDERFLTMVVSALQFPKSIVEYFDSAASPLNPHNAGYNFFVYGTLPIFLVRLLGEWAGRLGYDEIHLVGRAASATFDLLSVFLVYLIGARLYGRRVGLLASALVGFSVFLIQHAHFFVVDPFANTFMLLGIYFAVRIAEEGRMAHYALFGLALGMALASKISAAPLAAMAVVAALIRLTRVRTPNSARSMPAWDDLYPAFKGLALAAFVSIVAFRLFQPYAFTSLLNPSLNPKWLANMAEIRNQSRGNVDFPPALQWANRAPILFAWTNLVAWGMGWPLGLASWAGWAWAVVLSVRGHWQRHLIPVLWTAGNFLWQSTGFTPSMRYQLPVYPTLALLAAWGIWEAWERGRKLPPRLGRAAMMASGLAGIAVLLATAAYAFGFVSIYARPVTRVAASRWIYTHVPGAANLVVDTDQGALLEPIPVALGATLEAGDSFDLIFTSHLNGQATTVFLPDVTLLEGSTSPASLTATLLRNPGDPSPLASATVALPSGQDGDLQLEMPFDAAIQVVSGTNYSLRLELHEGSSLHLAGDPQIVLTDPKGSQVLLGPVPQDELSLSEDMPARWVFVSSQDGSASGVRIAHLASDEGDRGTVLTAQLFEEAVGEGAVITQAVQEIETLGSEETAAELHFPKPAEIKEGVRYVVAVHVEGAQAVTLQGSTIVSESSWDDGLPLRIDGRDVGGLYLGANQELYWQDDQDDTPADGVSDKLQRIEASLAEGDFIVISSNRQYGTIPRVPQRYPLTTAYYRALFACPEPEEVPECGALAEPSGTVTGLGYELVQVFESHPSLGPFEVNDQLAEELFTVYDHPKVLIFAKRETYDPGRVRALLGAVDLSEVVHSTPKEASNPPPNLLLPGERLGEQLRGGTWSSLFSRDLLVNRSEIAAVIAWWALLFLFGVAAFPLTRAAFPGLRDAGYPISRLVGLLLVSWVVWILGSLRVPFSRATIAGTLLALALVSALILISRRQEFLAHLRESWRDIAWVEVLALVLFLTFLLIRLGNPDLWHPSKGGEKPMDFSYLNAVLKSTTFPPYDPWYAGGYINYYYYGFVLVGVPIKLLGLNPSVAYNLIIPTLYTLSGIAAFSVAASLVGKRLQDASARNRMRAAGLAAALALVVLGNLGTVQMIYDGWKVTGTTDGQAPAGSLPGMVQAVRGLVRQLTTSTPQPYGLDAWYWNPSRAIPPGPGEPGPITEFPFFTFLYADLHAHMINLPLTIVCLAWGLSWLLGAGEKRPWTWKTLALQGFVGGIALGALRPTNTWDFPVYWGLAGIAIASAAWARGGRLTKRVVIEAAVTAGVVLGLAYLLYQPYNHWYGAGYTAAELWKGGRTSVSAYLTVHGLFLFVLLTWIVWEARQWMASTPLSALSRLRPAAHWIAAASMGFLGVVAVLLALGYAIALVVFPVILVAVMLVLRPSLSLEKRIALILTAAAVGLTFVVEVVVLKGDIGRMNTVFKFYLQVWTLFSLASAAALVWILDDLEMWSVGWRRAWAGALTLLVMGAALYPVTAAPAKIKDRMAPDAPHSLDGMAFMPYAEYYDLGGSFSLGEDYEAIRWMQDHIVGSPVIVEANIPEYRWGSRFTIYTGLPGVLGWNWHQRQQRVATKVDEVSQRAMDINDFFLSRSAEEAQEFLERYGVGYVVVGNVERLYYEIMQPCFAGSGPDEVTCEMGGRPFGMTAPPLSRADCVPMDPGNPSGPLACQTGSLAKFETMAEAGELRVVYERGGTTIYEVVR